MSASRHVDHERIYSRLALPLMLSVVVATATFPIMTPRTASADEVAELPISVTAPPGMFAVGEDLLYEVSYSIFSLGTVRIEVLDTVTSGSETVYRAKAYIDSYNGVPFVNLHYVFFSQIHPGMYTTYFSSIDTGDSAHIPYVKYDFQYAQNFVRVEQGIRPDRIAEKVTVDTVTTHFQDGLSLFFYARAHVHDHRQTDIPTYVNEKKVTTFINFSGMNGKKEIDAVKYPIATVDLSGRADFVGIFGLTGGFRGWFSDDAAAVPIVARMNVILGSVHIELIKWTRPGWQPPKAQER